MKRDTRRNKKGSAKEVGSVLKQRIELLSEIWTLTKEQPVLINSEEDTEGLLENIKKRQILIDQLAEIQDTAQNNDEPECAKMESEIQSLLAEIARQDKINEETALKRMEDMKEKMMKIKQGRIAYNGYENPVFDYGATYFDKRK